MLQKKFVDIVVVVNLLSQSNGIVWTFNNCACFMRIIYIQGLPKRFELRGLCHNWNMTVLTLSISWMEPHATIIVMLGTSLTRHCHIDGLEEQSTMINIFYSGHRGHRTWHPVIFSYGDTLKTMPTNPPPPPQNVRELQDRIRAVVQTIDGNMLKLVWQQLDYRIDICRVTKGAHIEHLWADFYWWINLVTYITYVWNCILFWQLISKIYQI